MKLAQEIIEFFKLAETENTESEQPELESVRYKFKYSNEKYFASYVVWLVKYKGHYWVEQSKDGALHLDMDKSTAKLVAKEIQSDDKGLLIPLTKEILSKFFSDLQKDNKLHWLPRAYKIYLGKIK